jgi:predicted O-methyltransferase YrrM
VTAVRRDVLRALARTRLGRRALHSLAGSDPWLLLETLASSLRRDASFASVAHWPERLDGFDRLAFLFSSTRLNRAIASLDLDEAAYLYRLVHSLGPATIVEIGRFRGGGTFVLAAAMAEGSRVISYDVHLKVGGRDVGARLDSELRAALARYGLADRVELVVGDSGSAPAPAEPCDLVFVDGDHSYEGVRADVERWGSLLRPGGHLLLHDAVAGRELAVPHEGVARLAAELESGARGGFERVGSAGTLLHLRRLADPGR